MKFCLHLPLEMKKFLAILMMFTAYAILLVHNIVPHHHHNNIEELTEHHNSDYHHESNHQDDEHQTNGHHDGIGHLFSHFLHLDDAFSLISTININSTFAKHLFSFVSLLPNYFSFNDLNIPDDVLILPPEQIIYHSPHTLFVGLRAPPLS